MDLNERECGSPGKSNATYLPDECLPLDGHTLPAGMTCGSGRATGMNLLISLSADSPAKTSASPGSEPGLPGSGPASSMNSSASRKPSSRRGASLKMSQGCLALTADGIWPRSLKDFGNAGLWSATQCWTANISESRNAAAACSLSAVLQNDVSSKYFLSARAAAGILRRAVKRGRTLPPALEVALVGLASAHRDEAGKTI